MEEGGLKMEVIKITENEDGSATLDVNFTEEEINILVEYAVVDILKKHINKLEEDNKRLCFNCDDVIDHDILNKFPDTELCAECIINESDQINEETFND